MPEGQGAAGEEPDAGLQGEPQLFGLGFPPLPEAQPLVCDYRK